MITFQFRWIRFWVVYEVIIDVNWNSSSCDDCRLLQQLVTFYQIHVDVINLRMLVNFLLLVTIQTEKLFSILHWKVTLLEFRTRVPIFCGEIHHDCGIIYYKFSWTSWRKNCVVCHFQNNNNGNYRQHFLNM